MLTICSLYAHYMLTICSLYAHIRAGARKSGSKKEVVKEVPLEHLHNHIPATQPYEAADVMGDLLQVESINSLFSIHCANSLFSTAAELSEAAAGGGQARVLAAVHVRLRCCCGPAHPSLLGGGGE
jgi:hypothetical protein